MAVHDGDLAARTTRAMTAYRLGDSQALALLVEELTPVLWHLARHQGLDATAAEDVVQTAWLRLVERHNAITDPGSVLKWLMTTTRREAWRVSRAALRDVPVDEPTDPPLDGPPPPDLGDALGEAELGGIVWRHVRTLSARCQELLKVIAFADRPDYAAVSVALGMPLGSIGPTRGRCLAKLRTLLETDPAWEVTA